MRGRRVASLHAASALVLIALLAVSALAQEKTGLTPEDSKAFIDNPAAFLANPANAAKLPDAIKVIGAMNDADMAAFGKKLFANYGTLPQNAKDAIHGMMLEAGFDMTAAKNKAFAAEYLTTQGVDDKVGAKFIETVTRTGANAGLTFSIDASTGGAKPTMKALPDGSYVVSAGERQFVLGPQPPGRSLVYTKEGTENVLRIVDGEFGMLLPEGETRADSTYSTALRVKMPGDDRLIIVDPTTTAKITTLAGNVVVLGQAGQKMYVPPGADIRALNGVVRVSRTGGAEPYAVQLFEKDQMNAVTLTVPAGGTFSSRSIGEGTSVTGQLSKVSYVSKLGPVSITSETTRDTGVWIGNGIRFPRDTNGAAMDGIAINTGAVDAQNPPVAFAGEVKGTLTLAEGKETNAQGKSQDRTISYNGNVPGMVVGVDKGANGLRYPILENGDLTAFKQASMSKDNGMLQEALKQRLGLTDQEIAGLEGKDLEKKIKDNIKVAEKALKDAKKALAKLPSGKDAEGDIMAWPNAARAKKDVETAEAALKEAKALQVQVAAARNTQYVASGEAFQIVMQDPEKIHYDAIKMNYDERGGGVAGGTLKPLVISSTIGPLTAADGFTVEYNGYTSDGKPVKSLSYNGATLAYNERGIDGQFLQSENVGMLRLQGSKSADGSVTYAIDRSQLLSAGAQGLLGSARLSMLEREGAAAITSGMAPLATLTPTAQGIDLTLQTKLGLPAMAEKLLGGLLFSNDGKLGTAVNSALENLGVADPTINNAIKDALAAGQPALAKYAKENGVPDSISLSVTPVPTQKPTAADNKNLEDAIERIWAATSETGLLGRSLDPAKFDSVMKNPPEHLKKDVDLFRKWTVGSVQIGVTLQATKDEKTQSITPQGLMPLPAEAYDQFLTKMKEGVITKFYQLTIPSDPATKIQEGVINGLVEKRNDLAAAVGAAVGVPATAVTQPKAPGATTPAIPPASAPGSAPGSAPSSPPATPPASAPSGTVSAPATSPAGVYVDVPQPTGPSGVATGTSTTTTDSLTVDYVAKRVGIFPADISSIEPAPKIRTSDPQYYVAKSYSGGSEVWYYFQQQSDGSWKFKRQETR